MKLQIPKTILYDKDQTLTFEDNIITLVGSNGSGKSIILESIFLKKLENQTPLRIVSYSSGANESFSAIFQNHINKSKEFIYEELNYNEEHQRDIIDNTIKKFHFDSSWSRFLIFVALALKNQGKVFSFLKENNFIDVDASQGIVRNAYIEFPVRVRKAYFDRVKNILEKEKLDPGYQSIRRTFLHEYLTKLTEHLFENEYEFEIRDNGIPKSIKGFKAEDLPLILGNNIDRIFAFFAWSTEKSNFIFKKETNLYFKDGLELSHLSDGEYQLLVVYALIDLFDDKETLFLLDEIDSHLYFENVQKLWGILKNVQGKVITSTHSADSIVANNINNVRLVDKGKVESRLVANNLINRLEVLSSENNYRFLLASKIEYLALVEDESDWFIFKKLCEIKIDDFNPDVFEKIQFIKRHSGYHNSGEVFGGTKLEWVKLFNNQVKTSVTESIFLICDKDNLSVTDIQESGLLINSKNSERQSKIKLKGSGNRHAYLLSWKRREIENYLLSYTMLSNESMIDSINRKLSPDNQLKENDTADNDGVRELDIKDEIQSLYLKDELTESTVGGIDYEKLENIIQQIPSTEISQDIENLYNFINTSM